MKIEGEVVVATGGARDIGRAARGLRSEKLIECFAS